MKRNLRHDAKAILTAALAAADPTAAIEKFLRARDDLDKYERIFIVGGGKASGTMASAVERILATREGGNPDVAGSGTRIAASCVAVKDGDPTRTRRIELRLAGHPVPDERGVHASRRIAEICHEAGERDLVICLISGGASSLMAWPAPPVTLEETRATTQLLLDSGAAIQEINCIRKHMSGLKGGQLARLAAPARVLSLILSDVVGDTLDVIGSGPTAPDITTCAMALAVLDKYGLLDRVPRRVRDRFRTGEHETPKPGDPVFDNVENVIVGSNQMSLEAAARAAKDLGYHSLILSSTIEGETRDVARMHAAIARQIRAHGQPLRAPACIVSGGETTVTIRGDGMGGRNQEFALAAAIAMDGLEDTLILSAGTDGTDGPTKAAGAMADGHSVARSQYSAAESLANNDAYPFFEDLGDLVITGATGTNVMDLHLILAG
jgi:hydroxypyruvate reductase